MATTLELSGRPEGSDSKGVSAEKQDAEFGGTRIVVSMPRLVNAEEANLAAALLFEQIDQLSSNAKIERVQLTGFRFTHEGVDAIAAFLSLHAPTITSVSLVEMITEGSSIEDEKTLNALAQAFKDSKLLTLDLSGNTIQASMWKNWANQTGLRRLVLDRVEMDDSSIEELASQSSFVETLEELHVVLSKPLGDSSLEGAFTLLENCANLTSLHWANVTHVDSKLPWFGLHQMIKCQVMDGQRASLQHLVMEGAKIAPTELESEGLCGALRELSLLKTLKLVNVGLRDVDATSVVESLQISQPPLEVLDLSGNYLKAEGAKAITQLVHIESICSNIKFLSLERNSVDTEGGRALIHAFASKASVGLELCMDENAMNLTTIAMSMALAKVQVEKERDEMLKHNESVRNRAEFLSLQAENQKLAQEREVLMEAFSILGIASQVDEQKRLLARFSRLEDKIGFSRPKDKSPGGLRRLTQKEHLLAFMDTSGMPVEVQTPISNVAVLSPYQSLSGSHHTMSTCSSTDRSRSASQSPSAHTYATDQRTAYRRSPSFGSTDSSAPPQVDNVHKALRARARATYSPDARTSDMSRSSHSTPRRSSMTHVPLSAMNYPTPPAELMQRSMSTRTILRVKSRRRVLAPIPLTTD
jgi:Ran GTPase-activating protein (RanGAP) involved in mRNA processing and transport